MQTVESFMHEFFLARNAEVKRELAAREPFRERFFAKDCLWDSRRGVLERSEGEIIEAVLSFDGGAEVVTKELRPFHRLRYHLCAVADTWQIKWVEFECLRCLGTAGNRDCFVGKGRGWCGQPPQDGNSDDGTPPPGDYWRR